MGFCLFSGAAIAARMHNVWGIDRVAVVDFDVHHGNGTEQPFGMANLIVSSSDAPCPGTGAAHEGRAAMFLVPCARAIWCRDYHGMARQLIARD